MTVEELDIIVQAHIEGAVKEFQKLVPEIKKQTKNITKELNNSDIKNISAKIDLSQVSKGLQNVKQETKQVARAIQQEYGNAFKSTSKQQELLYEKIKQKQQELADMKTNGVPATATDDEIKAKMKQTGKAPQILDKTSILEAEAEIEKLQNRLISLQNTNVGNTVANAGKQIKTAFDDPNITNFTTNLKQAISGVSQEFGKLKGSKVDLGNAVELNNYKSKVQELSNIANKAKDNLKGIGYVKYDTSSIDNYISKIEQAKGRNLKNKMNNVGNQSFYAKNVPVPDSKSLSLWDTLRSKIQSLQPTIQQVKSSAQQMFNGKSENKTSDMVTDLKKAVSNTTQLVKKSNLLSNTTKGIKNITQSIGNRTKSIASNLSNGLGKVIKYAGALLSLRSIYMTLRQSASAWLSSQNAGAQQLSANIEYMKYAMGSALAPVIQFLTNLIYKLMKAIQSVVYALTGVNIFAKASASSMNSTAKGAKETAKNTKKAKEEAKQLAGVHDEINNIQNENNNDNGDTGASGGSSGEAMPSFDLSKVDSQLSPLAKKLYDFFKPLKESWDIYGPGLISQIKTTASQVGYLISSVWKSFEKIITNGTVYSILENILAIIGNIAEAFANAWNYNGNGDAIVQNLANAFNNLLIAINNVVKSPGFQEFLNWCSDKFREISEKIASINWQPFIDMLAKVGGAIGKIALEILDGLVSAFKWIIEHPTVAMIILGVIAALKGFSIFKNIISWLGLGKKSADEASSGFTSFKDAIGGAIQSVGQAVQTIALLGGIALVIGQITELIRAFSESGLSLSDVAILLASVLGELSIAFVAIAGASKLMDWQGVAGAAVILAGFALVINQVTGLLNAFSQSGLSVNDVCVLLGTIFGVLVGLMGSIAVLGPMMTAGLVPFSVAVAGISAILLVMKETIPTILDSCGKFINNIAPSVKMILETIGNQISNIINSLGNVLPPIINSLGSLFNTIFNGVSNVINSVGNVIVRILREAGNLVNSVLNAILNFINRLGPAINNFVDGAIRAVTKLINFLISGIEYMINTLIIDAINGLISAVNNIPLVDIPKIPRANIPRFVPRLEKGGVLYKETAFIGGEYQGASNNPEIVTPQNIMYDTMKRALTDSNFGNNNDKPLNLIIKVGNKVLGEILIDDLKNKKRRTGKGIEALVGG